MSQRSVVTLALLASGCFSPTYPETVTCSDQGTCPPGQGCDGVANQCTFDCANGACEINLNARAVRFESIARDTRSDVTLHITSVPGDVIAKSNAAGDVSIKHLAPYTVLELLLTFEQTDPKIYAGFLATRYLGPNISGPLALDVSVIEYRWLAQVATDCGIFPTLDDALYKPGTGNVNFYFINRATIIGEVFELDGAPAALSRDKIQVLDDGWTNRHGDPADDDEFPTHVCFLEPNPATGTYVGSPEDHTNSGRFVMFRVRNGKGVSNGFAQVQIPGYPDGLVVLRSAGDMGVVTIQKGVAPPPTPPSRSFADNVLPLMVQLGCPSCHTPGKPGYELSQSRGGLKADYSGTAEEVRAVLMAAADTCTETNPVRVCLSRPTSSLLYTKPRLETGDTASDHLGIAFPDGSTVLDVILAWISNGAQP
jgi:hypothetical protein